MESRCKEWFYTVGQIEKLAKTRAPFLYILPHVYPQDRKIQVNSAQNPALSVTSVRERTSRMKEKNKDCLDEVSLSNNAADIGNFIHYQ